MRSIVFHPKGWQDFTYWDAADKKMLRRRCAATCRASGHGGLMTSTVSFTAADDELIIAQARYHYDG